MNNISKKIFILVEKVHIVIFHHQMGGEMKRFLCNLSFTVVATSIAAAVMFLVNILAGRWLGPEEFGKYGVVISLGQVMVVFITLGTNSALVKYIQEKDRQNNQYIIAQAVFLFFFSASVVSVVLFLIKNYFIDIVGIDEKVFHNLLIFLLFLGIFQLTEAFNKGLKRFKFQAIWQIIQAIVIVVLFVFFFFFLNIRDFSAYLLPFVAGYGIYVFFSFCFLFREDQIMFRFSTALRERSRFRPVFEYAKYAIFGGIIWYTISGLDKIFLNKFTGFNQVGLFQAYSTAAITVLGVFYTSFINIFFPMATDIKDYKAVLQKIKKLANISFIPFVMAEFVIISIVIKLYGIQYEYNPIYAVLFSLICFFYFWAGVIAWLVAAQGIKGTKYLFFTSILISAGSIIINILLIPMYGMVGAIVAFLISMTLTYVLYLYIFPVEKYVF